MPGPTKADLQEEVERLRSQRESAEQALVSFKEQVVNEAVRVAREQGWCDDGLRESLSNLNLELPEKEYEITLTVEITLTASTSVNEINESFVRDSVDGLDRIGMDDDWNNVDVSSAEIIDTTYERVRG